MSEMTAKQASEAAKGLTFEDVWAALMETREQMKETRQQIEETNKQIEETNKQMKETDKKIREMSKNLGGLGNSLGQLIESMFSEKLYKKFDKFGYSFKWQCKNKIYTENDIEIAEADIYMENDEYVMIVEIKTELNSDHVKEHIKRLDIIRKYMDSHGDSRKLTGAVAGGTVSDNVLLNAQRRGLYVITQTSESVAIADMPEGLSPRVW